MVGAGITSATAALASRKALRDRPDRLFVVWAIPGVYRHVVGELWRAEGLFFFAYKAELLPKAIRAGFQLLTEFPEAKDGAHPYQAPYLFRTFQQRIPSPARADHQQILQSWGVVHQEDPFEVLAMSGGVLLTDRVELSEYRAADDDFERPLLFRLAGQSHYRDAAADLMAGTALGLQTRPQTPSDQFATVVLIAEDGRQVGWVPREYSQLVASQLERGSTFEARVERHLVLPEERGRWVVRLAKK